MSNIGHIIDIRRAAYGWGKTSIAPEEREYNIPGHGTAVGTLGEIDVYLARQGYDVVTYRVHDKDGVSWLKDRDLRKLRDTRNLGLDLSRD